jgi:glycosyltransferase involved in cell wall biosynthesis
MKIFYITQTVDDWGGSEIYTRDLILELEKRGHEIVVFTFSHWGHPNIKVYTVPTWGHHALHKFEMPLFSWKAINIARKFKPDIVQSHASSLAGLIGHLVKRDLEIPHVMLVELISSINVRIHGKVLFRTEKFLTPKLNFDKIVVWTENMKDNFLIPWGVDENKIVTLPAALNLANYDPSTDGSEIKRKYGENLITCLKTLSYTNAKGIKYIVDAMKIVSKKHPEYKLLIFAGGRIYKKSMKRYVNKLGLDKFVKILRGIPPEVYKKVCAATDVAPHSFVYEFSTSISLLEYMAMGRPCVVTDIGSVREFVGDSALLVKPEDPESMAEGIIKLIENPKLREKLGKKARERVEKRYSIKASVDELERIYGELLKK